MEYFLNVINGIFSDIITHIKFKYSSKKIYFAEIEEIESRSKIKVSESVLMTDVELQRRGLFFSYLKLFESGLVQKLKLNVDTSSVCYCLAFSDLTCHTTTQQNVFLTATSHFIVLVAAICIGNHNIFLINR